MRQYLSFVVIGRTTRSFGARTVTTARLDIDARNYQFVNTCNMRGHCIGWRAEGSSGVISWGDSEVREHSNDAGCSMGTCPMQYAHYWSWRQLRAYCSWSTPAVSVVFALPRLATGRKFYYFREIANDQSNQILLDCVPYGYIPSKEKRPLLNRVDCVSISALENGPSLFFLLCYASVLCGIEDIRDDPE